MKQLIVIDINGILFTSCFHKGAQSKYVKFHGYSLVGDGNDNDSSFFRLDYENKSDYPLKTPYVRMVIKDTSSKLFKPILFSDSKNLDDIPSHTFFSDGFQFSSAVGKVKCHLSRINSNGKRSVRRTVEY